MPRLIVPSSGGGTKLIRTLRAGGDVGDGEGLGVDVGDGDSCADPEQIHARANKMGRLSFFVIVL